MSAKKSNIIFMEGKEKILQKLFDSDSFGFLAVGYNSSPDDTNGFINVDQDDETSDRGFNEIEEATYQRVPLSFHSITSKDEDNGTVTAKFTAELDLDNVINNVPINQIAIVDSSDKNNKANTTYFAAAVTETFTKSEKLALVFVIEVTM